MKASIILPTYNRMPIIKCCLSHLFNQTVTDYEVILIDDCSSDGTQSYVTSLKYSNLLYIRFEERKGPYYARNLGVKEANGEIIIFLDSDVIVYPDFIEDHINIHKRSDNLILQGMVKHISDKNEISMDGFYLPNALCLRTFITQNVSVKKKWLLLAGGFDDFGPTMGYKDVDMGFQLKGLGLKWVYGIRRCKAFHIDGLVTESSLEKTFEKWKKQGASAFYFVKKWGRKGERYAHIKKALFLSHLLSTHRWIEKKSTVRMMIQSKKHFGIVWLILKAIAKYHYRRKGIEEARRNEGVGNSCKS